MLRHSVQNVQYECYCFLRLVNTECEPAKRLDIEVVKKQVVKVIKLSDISCHSYVIVVLAVTLTVCF